MQPVRPAQRDPAPSRLSYRLERLRLTPGFHRMLRVCVFGALSIIVLSVFALRSDWRENTWNVVMELRHSFETRPEFMISRLAIDGVTPDTAAEIRDVFPSALPVSSLQIDLDDIRILVEALPAVKGASVKFLSDGILAIAVEERLPVALWRTYDGLFLVDVDGVIVSDVSAAGTLPALPLIAGPGAEKQVQEALRIFTTAKDFTTRIRGLVRVGERRWDIVLTRDQRILLPELAMLEAVDLVTLWNRSSDLLERDLRVVDMRLSERPTLRMSDFASEEFQRITKIKNE